MMQDEFSYTSGTESVTYSTADKMTAWLKDRPAEIEPYHRKMYELADKFAAAKDYKGMRQALLMLVDVLTKLNQ